MVRRNDDRLINDKLINDRLLNSKHCLICGGGLPKRFRKFCSAKCRNRFYNQKYSQYHKDWFNRKRAEYSDDKKRCKICGGWYVQVGSHVFAKHKITARQYREEYGLPVKRGVVPSWYRKMKGEIALSNGTYKNLEQGKKYRFGLGDLKAKMVLFWKGRRYVPDEYYE